MCFGYEWKASRNSEVGFTLGPGQQQTISYKLSDERTLNTPIDDLYFVMEYKNVDGQVLISKRRLEQVEVPSKMFYKLEVREYVPPRLKDGTDIEIFFKDLLPNKGGGREGLFEIKNIDGQVSQTVIKISDTLFSTWGFDTDESVVSVLKELGAKLLVRMLRENNVKDFVLTTERLSNNMAPGYEGFKFISDNINTIDL